MEILISIVFFTLLFGIIYIVRTTTHKERMYMIEKGADPEKLSGSSLKLGMVCIGVALGLLVGPVLETHLGMPEPVAYFATVFLFGGIALVMHHIITGGKP